MNSGLVTVHNNHPEKLIDDLDDFFQYCIWLLSGHEGNIIQKNNTQVRTSQLDGGLNSHVFTEITIFTYIRPVKWNE